MQNIGYFVNKAISSTVHHVMTNIYGIYKDIFRIRILLYTTDPDCDRFYMDYIHMHIEQDTKVLIRLRSIV